MSASGDEAGLQVVLGAAGQLGSHVTKQLAQRGLRVRAVTRTPTRTPLAMGGDRVEYAFGDLGDPAQAVRLCAGASVVYACFGAAHERWAVEFPRLVNGLLEGAGRAGARVVFADNLYAYGPQREPLSEATVPRLYGKKPRLRAELAEALLAANRAGRLAVTIARASDLYGPGVKTAMLSEALLGDLTAGRRVFLPGDLDAPHTFTFVPDFAAAMLRLGADSHAAGEVWHVPSAPALSLREVATRVAVLAGVKLRLAALPNPVVRLAGLFSRPIQELGELAFQWDRPYLVSHQKFEQRYGLHPTPFDQGLEATLRWCATRRPELASRLALAAP